MPLAIFDKAIMLANKLQDLIEYNRNGIKYGLYDELILFYKSSFAAFQGTTGQETPEDTQNLKEISYIASVFGQLLAIDATSEKKQKQLFLMIMLRILEIAQLPLELNPFRDSGIELEPLINWLQIFETGEAAEKFLKKYYADTKSANNIEIILDFALPDDLSPAVRSNTQELIYSFTHHPEIILDPDNKRKFKMLIRNVASISDFLSIDPNLDAHSKMEEYINLLLGPKPAGKISAADKKIWQKRRALAKELQPLFTDNNIQKKLDIYCNLITHFAHKETSQDYDKLKLLLESGATVSEIKEASNLHIPDSNIFPDNIIAQADGYYICKLSKDDIRGPFLGLFTGCCQHLGNAGRSAAIYGYTQPNSCFYIMVRGQPSFELDGSIDTKKIGANKIIAQSWAWTNKLKTVVVLDSIEMDGINDSSGSKKQQQQVKKLFLNLAENLVVDPNNDFETVLIGDQQSTLKNTGIPADIIRMYPISIPDDPFYNPDQPEGGDNYEKVYSDAEIQRLFFSKEQAALAKFYTYSVLPTDAELKDISVNDALLILYGMRQPFTLEQFIAYFTNVMNIPEPRKSELNSEFDFDKFLIALLFFSSTEASEEILSNPDWRIAIQSIIITKGISIEKIYRKAFCYYHNDYDNAHYPMEKGYKGDIGLFSYILKNYPKELILSDHELGPQNRNFIYDTIILPSDKSNISARGYQIAEDFIRDRPELAVDIINKHNETEHNKNIFVATSFFQADEKILNALLQLDGIDQNILKNAILELNALPKKTEVNANIIERLRNKIDRKNLTL